MKKVFLSTSITDKIDGNGNVLPEYRLFIESILDGLRKADLEVSATIEYDGWRQDLDVPAELRWSRKANGRSWHIRPNRNWRISTKAPLVTA